MADNCSLPIYSPRSRFSKYSDRPSLDILILGQAGSGKSATGNSILLRRAFETCNSSSYGNSNIKSAWSEYPAKNGKLYSIKVTDGPCLEEIDPTIKTNERQACENIAKVLTEIPRGVHVIVVTVRMGLLFSDENLKAVEKLLGNGCLDKHGVIVVTGGDDIQDNDADYDDERSCLQKWCDRQTLVLQRWFQKCKNRVVLFDNRTKDESVRLKQLENFLRTVKQLAGEERYTSELFHTISKEYQEQIKKFGLPTVSEETREKISILQGKISQIDSREDLQDVQGNLQDVLEKIKIEQAISTISFSELQRNLKEMRKEQTGLEHFKIYAKQCFDEMVKIASLPQNDNLYHALGEKVRDLLRPSWFRSTRCRVLSALTFAGVILVLVVVLAIKYS